MHCFSSLVIVAALAVVAPAHAADLVPWAPNLDAAREQAGREGKLLFVHFWSTDCEPCKKVEQHVFSDQRVADAITRYFVPVKIDAKALPDVAKQYNVRSWPTDVVMTPTGQVMAKVVSPQGADTYLTMIQQVAANGGLGTVQNLYSAANSYLKPGANPPPAMSNQYLPAGAPRGAAATPAQMQPPAFMNNAPQLTGAPALPPAGAPPAQTAPAGGSWNAGGSWDGGAQAPTAQVGAPAFAGAAQGAANFAAAAQQAPSAAQQWASQRQDPNAIVGNMVNQASGTSGGQWGAPNSGAAPVGATAPPAAQPQAPLGPPAGPAAQPQGPPPGPAVVNNPMAAAPKAPAVQLPPGSPPLAMDGFCPVTLRNNQKWIRGDAKFGAVHRGRTYLFTSAEAQKTFLANPDSFSPVLSGIDPVRFAEQGERVDGRRQHGVYYRNQVFLFSDEDSLQRFWTAPERYSRIVEQAMLPGNSGTQLR